MATLDTNVSNYTLSELMAIVEIQDLTPKEIIKKTSPLINKFKVKNPEYSVFFKGVQSQLLQYSQNLLEQHDEDLTNKMVVEGFGNMKNEANYPIGEKQVSDWYENENLTQKDENQVNKITDRKQKIGVFGDEHVPMKREQIATTDTYQVPIKQDSLNPNLKNTISRFINLDSQFRQYTSGIDSTSTDYTLDLSDTLKDILSICLYSYQIPFNWYVIDSAYGNTCFWITEGNLNIVVSVPPGNYISSEFVTTLNTSFINAGFTFPTTPINTPVTYNKNNGLITMNLYGGVYTNYTNKFTIK